MCVCMCGSVLCDGCMIRIPDVVNAIGKVEKKKKQRRNDWLRLHFLQSSARVQSGEKTS